MARQADDNAVINIVLPTALASSMLIADTGLTIKSNIGEDIQLPVGQSQTGISYVKVIGEYYWKRASAALEINSVKGGVLLPRITDAQRDEMTASGGLLIYNKESRQLQIYIDNADPDVAGAWRQVTVV